MDCVKFTVYERVVTAGLSVSRLRITDQIWRADLGEWSVYDWDTQIYC